PVPRLRARAPLSRPRRARPPVLTGRTVGISLGIHLLLLLAVLLAPRPERLAGRGEKAPLPAREAVEYLDVGAWGGMATDPSASLPEPAAAAPTGITAQAMDSVIRSLPSDVVFPSRVPAGIRRVPGGPVLTQPGGAQGGVQGGAPGGQGATPGGAAGRGRRSGPGGLGPELGDPRLVVIPTEVPARIPTDEERYQEHFARRIQTLNDSVAEEADRQRRIRDWTITDRNGKKWGINDRGPVVNGRNVPLPVPIPVPRSARDREDEARREREQRRDIDRQADQTERERYQRERARAIRERNDREREQKGAATTPPAGGTQGNP
ncbi:MAG TPA: hypothetical protein VK358_01570, partial [Longimicrobium sp.]|nr:hypothetical protein [Longimicrobium sp.]